MAGAQSGCSNDRSRTTSTQTRPEGAHPDTEVARGVGDVRALADDAVSKLSTDPAAAKSRVEALSARWFEFEGTVRERATNLYLQMEDGLSGIRGQGRHGQEPVLNPLTPHDTLGPPVARRTPAAAGHPARGSGGAVRSVSESPCPPAGGSTREDPEGCSHPIAGLTAPTLTSVHAPHGRLREDRTEAEDLRDVVETDRERLHDDLLEAGTLRP